MTINRNQLKTIAVTAMLIDHIAWLFVPTGTVLGQFMHFIGRFTGPTMAYLLYEGFMHTSDRKKYAIRLGVFALISWIPFCSFEYQRWCIRPTFGVIYTLFLGYIAMWYYAEHEKTWKTKDFGVIIALLVLSLLGDWPVFDVAWPFVLIGYRHDEKEQMRAFWFVTITAMACFLFDGTSVSLYQIGMVIPALVIQYLYDGKEGKKSPFSKWFFYIFYPLHLVVLVALKLYL